MKKKSKGKLKKECWALMSKLVRAEKPYCEICGKPTAHAHHIIPRSRGNSIYFLRQNIVSLCAGCHLYQHTKASPEEILEMARDIKGRLEWAKVEACKNMFKKYTYNDLLELREELKEQLKGVRDA